MGAGRLGLRDLLLVAIAALTAFGIAMIYSAGEVHAGDVASSGAWSRQAVWFGIAVVAFLSVASVPVNWLHWGSRGIYAASMVLLAATLVIGTGRGTAAGVKSWIDLGPVGFQPSEVAKVATVLFLAAHISNRTRNKPWESLQDLAAPLLIVGLPLGMVMLQPDLGTAMAFVGILFGALYWAAVPISLLVLAASPVVGFLLAGNTLAWSLHIVAVIVYLFWLAGKSGIRSVTDTAVVLVANLVAGAAARPIWNSLADYQKNRILVWLDPNADPQGVGYQIIQSKAAIGGGGLMGQGFLEGPQKGLGFLPEQHTDFIFGVVGEELGFLGASAVILAFGAVLFILVRMASRCSDEFGTIVLAGIAGSWFVHIFVNIGMTMGVVPITGIPLPFVSYGGTFLLMSWVSAAICWRVGKERQPL